MANAHGKNKYKIEPKDPIHGNTKRSRFFNFHEVNERPCCGKTGQQQKHYRNARQRCETSFERSGHQVVEHVKPNILVILHHK